MFEKLIIRLTEPLCEHPLAKYKWTIQASKTAKSGFVFVAWCSECSQQIEVPSEKLRGRFELSDAPAPVYVKPEHRPKPLPRDEKGEVILTPQDKKFLRALKISTD